MESPRDTIRQGSLPRLKARAESLLLIGIVIAVGWFYLWTVWPQGAPAPLAREYSDYYNLLTRGFLKGHLYLDAPADPYLAHLKDPWNPAENGGHGMHDVSYYRGRYYIYFGVTPLAVLFLPMRLISGYEISQEMASVVFAWVGLAASAWIVAGIRRRYFPGAPFWASAVAVAALGLTNTVPVLLRRASIWEVPITCAYACLMLGLGFLFGALHERRRNVLLVLASASFGLAVGARPTYLPGCAALLVPLLYFAGGPGGLRTALRDRSWWKAAAAAALPVLLVGAGLAAYNRARFGSFTEFGLRYQLAGSDVSKMTLFDWRFIPYGFRLYWLLPASWSPYFPFLSAANIPIGAHPGPGAEDPFGILPNLPYVLLGLGAFALAGRHAGRKDPLLATFCRAVMLAVAANTVVVLAFAGIANRYMVDFEPGLVLIASIGLLGLAAATGPRGSLAACLRLFAAGLFAYSAAFNLFATIRHNGLFQTEHRGLYQRMVHSWNRVPYAVDRWFHHGGYGDIELKVVFPSDAAGSNEPLVVTGNSFLSDYLVVNYRPDNVVTFGMDHTSHGAVFGEPFRLRPDTPHVIVASMGSLYPPPGHPYFDSFSLQRRWGIQNRVKVTIDGTVALDAHAEYYDATSWEPSIGRSRTGSAYLRPFSGRILSSRRIPVSSPSPPEEEGRSGPARLSLRLPAFTNVRSEPLLCTGEAGAGDLVFIRYLAPGKIAVGFDHWGYGGPTSAPVEVEPSAVQTVTVDYGALHAAVGSVPPGGVPGRLVVTVNGRTAVDQAQAYYPGDRSLLAIGDNMIGSSVASRGFSGDITGFACLGP